MTTKTKDPAAELAKLEAAAAEAQAEVDDTRQRLHLQQAHRQQLEAELAKLGRAEPGEFDHDGRPKGEIARKLSKELAEVSASRLPDVLAGAEESARAARDEVTRYIGQHAEGLARAEFEGPGKAAVAKMKQGAALIAEGHGEYVGSAARQMQFCAATPGLDGQDVLSDQRAAEIARQVAKLDDLAPPRGGSLTPLASDEVPRRWKVKSGGFVKSALPVDLEGVRQPERVSI